MPAVRPVHQYVDEAADFLFGAIEAQETCVHHARLAVTARDGVGQPARGTTTLRAAVRGIAQFHASVAAQLAIGAAALVDIRRIDDQRTTSRAQPADREQRCYEGTSKRQN